MKVLFDCIVTSIPEKCSTTVQFITLANMLLAIPDIYIYWPVPDRLTPEEMGCYPVSDRIKYIPIHQYKDRMKEYNRISPQLEDLLSFNGKTWDWDVLVTVRSTQIPMMRIHSVSPRNASRAWTKRIILIENMMISSKKKTVACSAPIVQDRMTIEAYLAADYVFMPAYHQKKWIVDIAKQHFSPARVRDVSEKVLEVCTLDMPEYSLKTTHKYKGGRKMGVAFVGRLEKFDGNIVALNDIMIRQFIMRSEDLRLFVCTVTNCDKVFNKMGIEILHPKRDEFWRICREEMDVAVSLTVDVELNLSMLEPISFGVPLIVRHAPWSVAMFGESYPFFISSETQMFALITKFKRSYAKCYALFAKWHEEWFVPTYQKRSSDDSIYDHLLKAILAPMGSAVDTVEAMRDNSIMKIILEECEDEFKFFELIERLGETRLTSLADKIREGDRERRGIVWSTPWNDFRVALKQLYGFEDAGIDTGHLRRGIS